MNTMTGSRLFKLCGAIFIAALPGSWLSAEMLFSDGGTHFVDTPIEAPILVNNATNVSIFGAIDAAVEEGDILIQLLSVEDVSHVDWRGTVIGNVNGELASSGVALALC